MAQPSIPDTNETEKSEVGAASPTEGSDPRVLPPAAMRALAEAKERKAERERAVGEFGPELAPERGGRDGPEPTRYGDWEKKGIAVDF